MHRIDDNLLHFGSNKFLVQIFIELGVEFVLVGGLAISWYCPDRKADDMDLLVNPSEENSGKICSALTRLGMGGFHPSSFLRLGLQVPLKQYLYAELLTPEADAETYFEVASESADARLFGLPIRVASVSSLLKMKRKALVASDNQREKHKNDIECLESHTA